jgi:hypothetical protein
MNLSNKYYTTFRMSSFHFLSKMEWLAFKNMFYVSENRSHMLAYEYIQWGYSRRLLRENIEGR